MALGIEDRLAIHELYARYNHAIDLGDPKGWAATFTEDGVFQSPTTGTFEGTQALVQFAERARGIQARHWTNNLVLDGDGKVARGSCYLLLLRVDQRPATLLATGLYRDELVRTPGGWRFRRRTVEVDG
jgi:hypothetical protein